MARSTLLALLVLALIQVIWAQTLQGSYLVNEAAKGVLKGYPGMKPFVKPKDVSGPYRTWFITLVDEKKITLSLAPEQGFLTIAGEQLIVADVPHKFSMYMEKGLVSFESSLGEGLFLTWDEESQRVTLQPWNKEPGQWWRLQSPRRVGYNRLNLQD